MDDEEFDPRVKLHNSENRLDWKWENFFWTDKPNSFYRQNIKRKDYRGNGYMIDEDIKWDIEHGWIKKIWKLLQTIQIVHSRIVHKSE